MIFVLRTVVDGLELLLIKLLLNLKEAVKHLQLLVESVVLVLRRLGIYNWLIGTSHCLVFHLNVFLELIILNRVTIHEGRCHFLTRELFLELLRVDVVLKLPESLQVLSMKELLLVVEIIQKLLVAMILSTDVLFKVDVIDIVLLRNDSAHRL